MKGLNKIALVTAIAALSAGAQAELKAMDDSAMSAATGQAGITIELSAEVKIGEVAYVDQDDTTHGGSDAGGKVFMTDIRFGGAGMLGADGTALKSVDANPLAKNSRFDNALITIDVAGSAEGDGSTLTALADNWGMGKVVNGNNVNAVAGPFTGGFYQIDITEDDGTGALVTTANTSNRETRPLISDGDLVIGLDIVNPQMGLVDFGLMIGEVSLGKSSDAVGSTSGGSAAAGNTVLMSNLEMNGAFGPVDIVIDGQNGGMNINAWFGLEGSVDIDFMNTSLDFKLHDLRGQTKTLVMYGPGSPAPGAAAGNVGDPESAAHVQMQINAVDNQAELAGVLGVSIDAATAAGLAVQQATGVVLSDADAAALSTFNRFANFSGTEGLLIQVQDFSGDLDLTNITVGAGQIGALYITDMSVQADMLVYGH